MLLTPCAVQRGLLLTDSVVQTDGNEFVTLVIQNLWPHCCSFVEVCATGDSNSR